MRHGSLLNYLRRHENTLGANIGLLLDMCIQVHWIKTCQTNWVLIICNEKNHRILHNVFNVMDQLMVISIHNEKLPKNSKPSRNLSALPVAKRRSRAHYPLAMHHLFRLFTEFSVA